MQANFETIEANRKKVIDNAVEKLKKGFDNPKQTKNFSDEFIDFNLTAEERAYVTKAFDQESTENYTLQTSFAFERQTMFPNTTRIAVKFVKKRKESAPAPKAEAEQQHENTVPVKKPTSKEVDEFLVKCKEYGLAVPQVIRDALLNCDKRYTFDVQYNLPPSEDLPPIMSFTRHTPFTPGQDKHQGVQVFMDEVPYDDLHSLAHGESIRNKHMEDVD